MLGLVSITPDVTDPRERAIVYVTADGGVNKQIDYRITEEAFMIRKLSTNAEQSESGSRAYESNFRGLQKKKDAS